jgi:hypothetical protein
MKRLSRLWWVEWFTKGDDRGRMREIRAGRRDLALSLELYTGAYCDHGPQTQPWRRIGWGRFVVGGAGLWVDLSPVRVIVFVGWRAEPEWAEAR